MYTFPKLLKTIREESKLTQAQFAGALGVSTVLIAMVETNQKKVSRAFLLKLAKLMNVHPSSITPFIYMDETMDYNNLSKIEKTLIDWGEKMQTHLIVDKSKILRKYADK